MNLRQFPAFVLASGAFCAMTGVFLIQAIIFPPHMPDWDNLTTNSGAVVQAPSPIASPLPDKQLYDVIAARPLFSQSRRPAPGSTSLLPGSVPAPPIDFTLAGVVAAPNQKLAIVSKSSSGTTAVLRQGSIFEGWKVIDIQQTSISVQSETTTITLKLTR